MTDYKNAVAPTSGDRRSTGTPGAANESDNMTVEFSTVSINLLHVEQALNGLSMLLEEIADKSQNQAQEISWSNSILKVIIKQTEKISDSLRLRQGRA